MRVLLVLFALFLSACTSQEAAPRCDLTASAEVSFTGGASPDVVETRSIGADCTAATAVIIVRAHDGFPAWAWAAPFHPTFGGAFAPNAEDAGPDAPQMQAFLDRWAHPDIARTSAAPEWSETLRTTLPRDLYEDIRTRDLPMLCHLSGVARETCIYWESAMASGGELLQREITTP